MPFPLSVFKLNLEHLKGHKGEDAFDEIHHGSLLQTTDIKQNVILFNIERTNE